MLVWCSFAAALASRSKRLLGPGVQPELLRQHLEGDVPAQRDLLGLVDDAHAAAADLADDAVVAQALQRRQRAGGRRLRSPPGGLP